MTFNESINFNLEHINFLSLDDLPPPLMDDDLISPDLQPSSNCSSTVSSRNATPVMRPVDEGNLPISRIPTSRLNEEPIERRRGTNSNHNGNHNNSIRSHSISSLNKKAHDGFNELCITEFGEEHTFLRNLEGSTDDMIFGNSRRQQSMIDASTPISNKFSFCDTSATTPRQQTTQINTQPQTNALFPSLFPPILSYQFNEGAIPLVPDYSEPIIDGTEDT